MKIRLKLPISVLGLLILSSGVLAQVSCSPNVDKTMCADAAKYLNPIVDHGTPYHGVGIGVEIVTPAEYAKRLSDTKELEKREMSYAGGMDKAAKSPDKFSPFYRHTLANAWSEDITFFRGEPASNAVSSILISSVAFERFTLGPVDAKTNVVQSLPTGTYDSSRLFDAIRFIAGYLCGTMSRVWDGSIVLSDIN